MCGIQIKSEVKKEEILEKYWETIKCEVRTLRNHINNRIRNGMSLSKNVAVLFLELIGDANNRGLKDMTDEENTDFGRLLKDLLNTIHRKEPAHDRKRRRGLRDTKRILKRSSSGLWHGNSEGGILRSCGTAS
ncbi:hypothetical protein Naga_100542g1 [Nannochloropsis gaditana]|uniref:Uncharacterized protein n=1 Tax=Nannochloropsis gaditana TaxID=72520 RepID=W7TZ07_9STRA|nr:hypothetical protein Naga_100542g1 [Nannochloropsis gaditana]